MKKRNLKSLMAALLAISMLAGCSGGGAQTAASNADTTAPADSGSSAAANEGESSAGDASVCNFVSHK